VLVLTRRAGESIVIGDEVRVVVLDVRGDTVRLGIEAPRSVQVHRAEVYAEVQAANAAAVSTTEDLGSVADRLQKLARPRPGTRTARPAGPAVPRPTPPGAPVPAVPVPAAPGAGVPVAGAPTPTPPAGTPGPPATDDARQ